MNVLLGRSSCAAALLGAAMTLAILAGPARTAGEEPSTPTCKKGEVYDKKAGKCVKRSSANLTDEELTDYAYALAQEGRYDESLDLLAGLRKLDTAEALNYKGFAMRKLGRVEEGIGYYLQSIAINPRYAKVREYLGEAYIQKGTPELAREQLAAIESICGKGCEEYQDLAKALATN